MSNVIHRTLRRIQLDRHGYKLLWEVETVNHDGDITTISSWVPKDVPANKYPWGYKDSVYYKDMVLVERFVNDGDPMSTSTYIHGAYKVINHQHMNEKEELADNATDVQVEPMAIAADNLEMTPEELEQPLIQRYIALTGASVDSIRAYLAAMEEDFEFDFEKAAEFMEDE